MIYKLIKKREIRPGLFDFEVEGENLSKANPGQFLHVYCGGGTFLRRPISVCETTKIGARFIFEARGEGTRALSTKNLGDDIDILGPLGHGFNPLICKDKPPILAGGGIGIFPLLGLAKKLENKNPIAILGFRSKELAVLVTEFEKICAKVIVMTDDGGFGQMGTVADALTNEILDKTGAIFTCGPRSLMMKITEIGQNFDIPVEASLEERMACGVGACAGCVVKTKSGENKKVCADGPVFDASLVDWRA
jgi:dihydroorotate dehydrogenase electron transfer subunit